MSMPPRKIIGLLRQNSSLGMEFIWVVVAQLFTLVGGLLTIKLLSNLLSGAEFGLYSLIFSVASLLVAMLFLPLGQINMRFLVMARQSGAVEGFYADQKRMLLRMSAISIAISIPCAIYLGMFTQHFVITYIVLAFLTLAIGYQTAQQFLLMAFRMRIAVSVVQMIGAVARPLGAFLAIWLLGYFAISAIFGLALGFLVLSLSQYLALRHPWSKILAEKPPEQGEHSPEQPSHNGYLSYGFFHALIGIVSAVVLYSDRWLLSALGSLEQVATYAALMQIALAPTAFAFAILTRLSAPIYFASRALPVVEQNKRFWIILGFWLLMCIVILAVTVLFHQSIVLFLTHAEFIGYSYLLPWMVLGFLLERTAQVLELKGALMLKTGIYVYARIMIMLLVPLSEFVFFRMLGFDGLALGLVLATGVSLVSIAVVNHFNFRQLS